MSMLGRLAVKAAKEAAERETARAVKPAVKAIREVPDLRVELPKAAKPKRAVVTSRKPTTPAQGELFPGYNKSHRETRRAAFLKDTHAVATQMSSRDTTPTAPLTLYHATTAPEFDAFRAAGIGKGSTTLGPYETPRQGIFMAEDPRVSEYFIQDDRGGYLPGGRMLPLNASLKNPFYMTDSHISPMLDDPMAIDRFQQAGIDLRGLYHGPPYWENFDTAPGAEDDFVGALRKLGYDSAYFEEPTRHMDVPSDVNPGVWVAFDPTQVKSATGNVGAFDPTDPNLRKARGGLAVKRRKRK